MQETDKNDFALSDTKPLIRVIKFGVLLVVAVLVFVVANTLTDPLLRDEWYNASAKAWVVPFIPYVFMFGTLYVSVATIVYIFSSIRRKKLKPHLGIFYKALKICCIAGVFFTLVKSDDFTVQNNSIILDEPLFYCADYNTQGKLIASQQAGYCP